MPIGCGESQTVLKFAGSSATIGSESANVVGCGMSLVESEFSDSFESRVKRRVSIGRDGNDFIVTLQPEELVVFRNADAAALRKVCRHLRWEIVSDSSLSQEALSWSPAPISIIGPTF
jgi:hypothetical protein